MTRAELELVHRNAAYIFKMSRLTDVRQKAKEIALAVEKILGQVNGSAEYWTV